MSFVNLSLDHPVARMSETSTGALVAMGARFVMDAARAEGRFGDFDSVPRPVEAHGLVAEAEPSTAGY